MERCGTADRGHAGKRRLKSLLLGSAIALSVGGVVPAAQAETVLRVGMTAADIPIAIGQPDQGFEGFRFMGYMVYDALVLWDLSQGEKTAGLMPGLATEWSVDPNDKKRWIFKLRQGVKFHDGSDFTADDVVWNFTKVTDTKAPHYEARQAGLVASRIPDLKQVNKIDSYTVEVITGQPTAYVPYEVSFWMMSSRAQYEKLGSWDAFAKAPSGTGPWRLEQVVPRERAVMVRNASYWNPKRVPKVDKAILMPIPEASARTAALLSGQVDWIEAPSPDTVPRLKSAGMQVVTKPYPHNWAIHPSRLPNSPWNDIRVRKAANLCVDREGLNQLLGGLSVPSKGHVVESDPWFGKPKFKIGYRPEEARALMKEAGFSKAKPQKVKIAISTSGSGQMQPLPMFEFIQANLNECFFDVQAEVMEWNALTNFALKPADAKEATSLGVHSVIISRATQDPYSGFERFFLTSRIPPAGANWGKLDVPFYNETLARAAQTFDPSSQAEVIASVHERLVDEAEWIWITHDVNPRALSPKVKGFVQAQSWFQDLTPVYLQ